MPNRLVHATMNSVRPRLDTFSANPPQATLLNFMDEGLITELNEKGIILSKIIRSLICLAGKAEESLLEQAVEIDGHIGVTVIVEAE